MKFFFTAFGLHNPFVSTALPEHGPIPMAIDAPGGLDLDYSSLLIAEQFIIDRSALEFVEERKQRFLGPMWQSLTFLQSEGLLSVANYGEPCAEYRAQILEKTSALVESVDPWIPVARTQWRQVSQEFEEFARLYSQPETATLDAAHYGVVAYLTTRDGAVDPREYARLHKLLLSRRRRLSAGEETDLREIVKPLVAQVLINDLLREHFGAPFIDWDDARGFYGYLEAGRWSDTEKSARPSSAMAHQSRALFQAVVPELRPSRIQDVVKFIRNRKAVASLREELWTVMREGGKVSDKWMLSLQTEATKAQLRAGKRSRKIRWYGRLLNPATWFMPHAVGIASEVLLDAAGEGVEHLMTGRTASRFEWYYALQELNMESKK